MNVYVIMALLYLAIGIVFAVSVLAGVKRHYRRYGAGLSPRPVFLTDMGTILYWTFLWLPITISIIIEQERDR